jgi:TP901 family phage tail tape measure protein
MARTIRDEILRWTLVVNGDEAKKELNELNQENKKIAATIKDLEKESRRLERSKQTEGQRYKEITAELKQLNSQYSQNKARIEQLHGELGITGKTMAELRHEAKLLRHQLANTVPGTAGYRELEARLNAVNRRMNEVQGKAGTLRGSFQRLAEGANKYFNVIAGAAAVITGFVLSMREMITGAAELADQQANVMKTTGLTIDQVRELQNEFKSLNTRTSRLELLKLAEEAGRLGKSGKRDILDFVRSADMIKVALGDDLGESEAIRDVGKLTEQFKVAEKSGVDFGEAMQKLGSGINEVSASGANMAPFLVDFMKRIAGIDNQVGLGAANVMGYAAALDEAGQSAEVGGTVFNKILPNMFKDPATYARIAGMEVNAFAKLLKKDANEALLVFLRGLNGSGEGFDVMAKKMEELKLDGARAVSVLASLANNTDKVRERQQQANAAMEEGVSLSNEFAIKNNNLAASWERVKRFVYQSVLVNTGAMSTLEGFFGRLSRWIEIPLTETLENQRVKLAIIQGQLVDGNITVEKRVELIKQLKDEYPEYLGHLDAEGISNQKLHEELEKVNRLYMEKIRVQAMQEALDEANRKAVEAQQQALKHEMTLREEIARKQGNLRQKEGESLIDYAKRVRAASDSKGSEYFSGWVSSLTQYEAWMRKTNKALLEYNRILGIVQNDVPKEDGGIFGGGNLKQQLEDFNKLLNATSRYKVPGTDGTAETPEERAERIKKEREDRDKAHKDTLQRIENYLKGEQALHAEARAKGLMTAQQYEEGLRMMQVTGFSMRGNALKAYLSQLAVDETQKRSEVNGQLADIRKAAAEWEISDIQEFNAWAEAELEKHFKEIDAINEREYEKLKKANAQRRRDSIIGAELDVLKAAPGSSEELEARKRLLHAQQEVELENTQLTELEKEKIIVEFQKRREQLDREYFNNYAQVALQSIGTIVSSHAALSNSRIQKELDEERQANDAKKQDLRRQLDSKRISEENYRTRLAALDDEYLQKEREMKTEQFKRQRNADAVQATINTALAISRALPNIPLSIFAGVAGGAQVGAILATPIPAFSRGKYPVTTTEGKRYNATYSGPVKTGMYTKPTVGLFAEDGRELIISSPHVKHLEMNYPEIIDAILYSRMPAFAGGRYNYKESPTSVSARTANTLTNTKQKHDVNYDLMIVELAQIKVLLGEVLQNPTPAEMSWRQYNDFKESAENLEKKYGV